MLRRSAKFTILPVMCLLMGAAPFQAKKWTVEAEADSEIGENMYLVVFPEELGGEVIEMAINKANYKIGFDTERGRATLIEWRQETSAIEIMGMSTGPILITLEPNTPRRGLYEPDGGVDGLGFAELSAVFRIEFDDSQLKAIGLTSPFIMPAFETANIHEDGILSITADGQGLLLGYPLSFICIATSKLKSIELD